MPLPVALSIKELLGDKRRNIILIVIIAILAISTNTGFALLQNYGIDTEVLLRLAGLEAGLGAVSE